MSEQQNIINWFVENDYKKVRVIDIDSQFDYFLKDVEYECKEGITTPGGHYKNGWRTTVKKGKNSDTKYLQIFIYTSASNRICVEEKFMFKIIERNQNVFGRYKLVSWKGWDNIDLMRMDWQSQYMGMLTALYKSNLNKDKEATWEECIGYPKGVFNSFEEMIISEFGKDSEQAQNMDRTFRNAKVTFDLMWESYKEECD